MCREGGSAVKLHAISKVNNHVEHLSRLFNTLNCRTIEDLLGLHPNRVAVMLGDDHFRGSYDI